MKKYLAALLVAVGMLLVMAAPAFAQECSGASCELQPGQTVKSRDPIGAPPLIEPGISQRTTTADENDPSSLCTGRGDRILGADAESCQPFPG